MPRLNQVRRSQVTDPFTERMYQQLFGDRDPVDEPGTSTGSPGDWWTVYALSPDVLSHAVRGFSLYGRGNRKLPPLLRELAQTRAGWAVGSQFVFSQHCKALRSAGASEEQVANIIAWSTADCYNENQRAVLAYTDCLALQGGRVPDELFARLQEALGDEEILELSYITGMYILHATVCRALRLEFDDRQEPIVEVAAPEGAGAHDIGAAISDRS